VLQSASKPHRRHTVCQPAVLTRLFHIVQSLAIAPEDVAGVPLMVSAYCWAQHDAEAFLMLLLDDGTEPIPECHSGTSFPGNRRGQLSTRSFDVGAGKAAEVHLVADCDLSKLRRATILLRGRRAPVEGQSAVAALEQDPGGLIMGSAGLRFVPNCYRDLAMASAVTAAEVLTMQK
jgi:hypothetical protein